MLFTLCLMALATLSSQAQSRHYALRAKIEATRIHFGTHRLDSIIRTTQDSRRAEKNVMEYDGENNLKVINTYAHANGQWEPSQRMEYTINDFGLVERSTVYTWENGEYCIAECEEVEQFTLNGQPRVVVISERLGAEPSAGIQPVLKQVVTGMHQDRLTDYDLYAWQMGKWILIGHSHTEYGDEGRHVSEVLDFSLSGLTMAQGVDIDYDDYGQPMRMNEYVLDGGEKLYNVETFFGNVYDDDGLLILRTVTSADSGESSADKYYWSLGTTTDVKNVAEGRKPTSEYYYDMSGRRHHGRPTLPGVYLIDGQKRFIK